MIENEENVEDELLLHAEINLSNNIAKVLIDKNGQFLVELNDDIQSWMIFEDDHPKVIECLESEAEDPDVEQKNEERIPMMTNLRE